MQHQLHFERKFYLDRKSGYWISVDYPRIRAHAWVWKNINGIPPKGHHIHHIDGNKSNNSIENLQCLSVKDHVAVHRNEDRIEDCRKRMEMIRPLTKAWHASEEGKEWHRQHAIRCEFGKNEPIDYECLNCSIKFSSSKLSNTKFCSNKCKSAHRRKLKIDDRDFACEFCTKIFRKNKYAHRRFCSRKCAASKSKIDKEAG